MRPGDFTGLCEENALHCPEGPPKHSGKPRWGWRRYNVPPSLGHVLSCLERWHSARHTPCVRPEPIHIAEQVDRASERDHHRDDGQKLQINLVEPTLDVKTHCFLRRIRFLASATHRA